MKSDVVIAIKQSTFVQLSLSSQEFIKNSFCHVGTKSLDNGDNAFLFDAQAIKWYDGPDGRYVSKLLDELKVLNRNGVDNKYKIIEACYECPSEENVWGNWDDPWGLKLQLVARIIKTK